MRVPAKYKWLSIAIFLCVGLVLPAQQALFVQNKGQWQADFDYRLELAHGAMFFEKNGYSLTLLNPPHRHIHDNAHHARANEPLAAAFKMRWLGANKKPLLLAQEELGHKLNFFLGNNPKHWQSQVKAHQKLTYQNIYPGINLEYFGQGDQLKYDIIINPGADPRKIKMHYLGLENIQLQEGRLHMQTALGQIIESIPEAYQIINGKKINLACHYLLQGNEVQFSLANYNPSFPVVIDPVLMFASFSGSGDLNFGNSATPGKDGSVYGAGVNFGANYPTTVGSFQANFSGDSIFNVDITISKFNDDGSQLLYATYLGGRDIDIVHSLIVDEQGNLIIMGSTGSSDFPIDSGAFQKTFGGGNLIRSFAFNDFNYGTDLFISKLNPRGSKLLASTFWGGNGNDGYNQLEKNYGDHFRGEVILDDKGNIAVLASTTSLDLPLTVNAGQSKTDSSQDAMLAVFSNDLRQQYWGRYFGGSKLETGYSIRAYKQKLYITGSSYSNNLPIDSFAYQPVSKGGLEGYLAAFDGISGHKLAASYFGTDTADQSFFVDIDRFGGVYLFGQTDGSLLISPGKYGKAHSSQFIAKLDSNLSRLEWQTTIGSGMNKQDLVPSAFMVDQCQNIYLAGWNGKANMVGHPSTQNGNTHGLSISGDAHQSNTDGSDFYFMILKREADNLLYASYLGGSDNEHIDGGTSRFSEDGTITQAICTNCNNRGFPSTPGVYSPGSGSPTCNMAVVKFSFDKILKAKAQISFTTGVDSICDGLVVNFDNTSLNATNYKWYFGNGDSSVLTKPSVTYDELGSYQVRLIAYDTICGVNDTAFITIRHNEAKFPKAMVEAEYVKCDAHFEARFNGKKSSDADLYHWDFGDGNFSSAPSPEHFFNNAGPHKVQLITLDTICDRGDTAVFSFSFNDTIPEPRGEVSLSACTNGELDIEFKHQQAWYQYRWNIEGREYEVARPYIRFTYPGEKLLSLTIVDTLCNRSYTQDFSLFLEDLKQETYIPSAFTPDGDGLNDFFEIFGDECTEGDLLQIFNRWGEMVYTTEKPYLEYWDGQYKGKPAPGGVYTFMLLTGQEKIQGSFTLLR